MNDAKGIDKKIQPADFKGKWLLVDFWGLSCRTCVSSDRPKLIKFYEEHFADRDRFEVVSICIDGVDGDIKTMDQLDKKLKPIIKKVWAGKALPFPLLLDSTDETWFRFGLPSLGIKILVDPSGKIVPGDETTLAEALKRK